MLVQAQEVNYDNVNSLVAAVGSVQIFYNGTTLEADRVTYNQKTKRLTADGNVRMTDQDGRITYAQHLDLSDDYRDGFVDSLRVDTADRTRMAATRADRSGGNFTVFQNGVYTACEACKEDPKKPPLWQVKAARIIHDQGEKMLYFESARLEFMGVPMAYLPYFYTPDPTVKRKTGFLMPMFSSNSKYGLRLPGALLHCARARLRPDPDAAHHHQAGFADAGRVQAEPDQWRLRHPRLRHPATRQGRVPAQRRQPGDARLSRLARRRRDVGPLCAERQVDVGLGWNAGIGPHVLPGLFARPIQVAGRRSFPPSRPMRSRSFT